MVLQTDARDIRWADVFENIETDAFDELALLAKEVAQAPLALVTLVDEDRHWFTSVSGGTLSTGPWEETFCSHAVRQDDLFVVADATRDARFAHNPLVDDAPYVRFYAGAPLKTHERVVGTLCVMDYTARPLPPGAAAGLRALARQVVMQLELRRQTLHLAEVNAALHAEAVERQRSEELLRHSEQALLRSQHDLQQIDAERRELVANISHDLRTPLTSLKGYLDTLLIKTATLDPTRQREYLEQASAQCGRVARLVNDLFELAQLGNGKAELKGELFELAELIRDVVQTFQLPATAKGIVADAVATGPPLFVFGDVRLIERVVENLVDNAIRFTPAGGRVQVSCEPVDDRAVVRVSDSGPGIAEGDQGRIFDRFYQGRQARSETSKSTGLGLAIAKRIVELHHGTIVASRSTLGGVMFSFSLLIADLLVTKK